MDVISGSFLFRVVRAACVGYLLLASAPAQPAWMKARVLQGRTYHSMAYDVARARVVVFGGVDINRLADTWEWDGSRWHQRTPAVSPGARAGHAMAYDLARQRVVLFGGYDATNSFADTWEWDGGNWTQLTPGTTLSGARATAACFFGLSAGTQNLPIPPCTLYLQNPIVLLPALTNHAGWAESPGAAIPLDIALRGARFHAQAFVADPQGPVLGLTFSAGLRLVVGD